LGLDRRSVVAYHRLGNGYTSYIHKASERTLESQKPPFGNP
jgi:hypothetical protein